MLSMCMVAAVPFGTPESVMSAGNNIAATTNLSDDYVQMLETLFTGLSLQVVQQTQPDLLTPHVHNQNMPTRVRHVAQTSEAHNTGLPTVPESPNLPDLVNPPPRTPYKKPNTWPSHANSHPSQELRVRRGYTPLRCRLDSLNSAGSSASESTTSTPFSTMESLMTPTPELMPYSVNPASPSFSPNSALYHHYAVPHIFNWSLTTPPQSPDRIPSGSPVFALDFPLEPEDMAQYQQREESSNTWREVGRDLRLIADNFAASNRQNGTRGANNAAIASTLMRNCDGKFPTVCSAVVAYVLWRLLKRFVAP